MTLENFLRTKEAEHGIFAHGRRFDKHRVHEIFAKISRQILNPAQKKIQILGTNGKGSTGRYLAQIIAKNNKTVLHFTSPHMISFSERFWKNGRVLPMSALEAAHQDLQRLPGVTRASFFEYAVFLAIFLARDVEFLVMEAGVGGELDATSVLDYDANLFCVIDFDHMDFLGETIKKIAQTKLRAMGRRAIIAPQIHEIVPKIAEKIANERGAELFFVPPAPDPKQPHFLANNFSVARFTAKIFGLLPHEILLDLPGRFMKFRQNLFIDVGHNENAANVVASEAWRAFDGDFVLIFNCFATKNATQILKIFKNFVKRVEILPLKNPRMIAHEKLLEILSALKIPHKIFAKIDDNENYLAFGSFKVAEFFLKNTGARDE